MAESFDAKRIPRERWARALAHIIVEGSQENPLLLFEIAAGGRAAFVKRGLATDLYWLKAADYEDVYDRIVVAANKRGYARH